MKNLIKFLLSISPLEKATVKKLKHLFEPFELSKGDHFAEQGKVSKEVGFIEDGIIRSYFINEAGKEYNKQFFVGPSLIGAYSSLLTSQKNMIAQQALSSCYGYKISYSSIVGMYDGHQDVERLSRKMSEYYFLGKEKKELEMALLDATKRYLLFQKEYPTLTAEISQYHIASYLSISPTQLSRIRKQLNRTEVN